MKSKYPISKEFFPFNKFSAPMNRFVLCLAKIFLRTPRFIFKDKNINTKTIIIDGYEGSKITLYLISPKNIIEPSNAIIFIHGGGFVFEGSTSHFKIAKEYALRCNSKVIYVKYNLAPKYPFPHPQYECFSAYKYVFDNAEQLGINKDKIGITGDSAGATLAVTSLLLAKEKNFNKYPLFQLLIYPWLDNRNNSESNKKYTDTPMWNSTLSKRSGKYTNKNKVVFPSYLVSANEYGNYSFLPKAYIEVAQYDCLRDDGINYAKLLNEAGIETRLYEVEGSMHGYETKYSAPTTRRMIEKRIEYINDCFKNK